MNSVISYGVFVAAAVDVDVDVNIGFPPSRAAISSSPQCCFFGNNSKSNSNPATRLQSSFRRDTILFLFLAPEGSFDNIDNSVESLTGSVLAVPPSMFIDDGTMMGDGVLPPVVYSLNTILLAE